MITPVPDPINEPDETVLLALGTPTNGTLGAPSTHTLTIQDESALPNVFFETPSQSRLEGSGLATVTVRLSALTALDVNVALTAGGTASVPADRAAVPTTVTIPSGSDQVTFSIPLVNDSIDELDETIILTILGADQAVRGMPDVHVITILDDDDPPLASLIAPGAISEEDGSLSVAVSLTGPSGFAISLPFTIGGTATQGSDLLVPASPLVIPAGSTSGALSFTLLGDTLHEGDETLTITLGPPSFAGLGAPASLSLTIGDDDPAPTVTLGSIPTLFSETAGTLSISVGLSAASALPVTIPFTFGGTTASGSDYTPPASPLVIAAGTTSGVISLPIVDDPLREGTETLTIALGAPTNGTLGSPASGSIDILDNEPIPVLSISPTATSLPETGGQVILTVSASVPSQDPIAVPFTLFGNATVGVDYNIPSSPIVIASGQIAAAIPVTAISDPLHDPNETIVLSLGATPNALLGPQTVATLTIVDDDPSPSVTITGPITIVEAAGSVSFTISLTVAAGQDIAIPYTVGGTLTLGVDFLPATGALVVPAGATTTTLQFPIIDDALDELTETIVITLGTPVNAILGSPNSITVSVLDDDPAPALSFSQSSATVDESTGTVEVTVTLSAPSALPITATLAIAGTADEGIDVVVTPTTISIPQGAVSTVVSLAVVDDGFDEPNEVLTLTLVTPTNASLGLATTFSLTVIDNDDIPAVQFAVSSSSAFEDAGTLNVTLTVSVPSALPIQVPFTISGGATSGVDFRPGISPVTILAGASSGTIQIAITPDVVFEADEGVILTLAAPTNATLGVRTSHTLTIIDDDPAPQVYFVSASAAVSEGAGIALVNAALTAAAEVDVVVPLTTGGSAIMGTDVQLIGSPLLFPAGSTTAQAQVNILDDSLYEGAETLAIGFGASVGATPGTPAQHTLTIIDNDAQPIVSFATASATAGEGSGVSTIAVVLSAVSGLPTTVPFTVGGSALAPGDFSASPGPLVIPAGAASGSIEIAIVSDLTPEGDEQVLITLGVPTNATTGAPSSHQLTILDDDIVPTVEFAVATQQIGEINGTAQIVANLSAPATLDVTIPFLLTGTAVSGLDYVVAPGPLVIPTGSVTGSILLTLIDDALTEADETIIATLGTPTNAALGAITVHTTTLLDDEATPVVNFALATQQVGEGAGVTTISVLLSSVTTFAVTIPYVVAGSAVSPGDLTITPGTLTITPGSLSATLTVNIVDDLLDEGDETAVISLGPPDQAALGTVTSHTLTILDDDPLPLVSFTNATSSMTEGDPTITVSAQLGVPSGRTVIVPLLLGGTAGNTGDLQLGSTQLLFPAGATTASVTVTAVDDMISEATELATISFGPLSNAQAGAIVSHQVTIIDDDAPPSVSFTQATSTFVESSGQVSIGLVLDAAAAATVTVQVTVGGSATLGLDATLPTTQVTFAPTVLGSNLLVQLLNDLIAEGNETLILTLTSPVGAVLGATTIHTVNIIDDETTPTISFATAGQSLGEGTGTATAVLVLSGPRDVDVVVSLSATGTAQAGVDYLAVPGQVTIPAGATTGSILIGLLDDILDEPDETAQISIVAATGVTVVAPSLHVLTILDDDQPPSVSFAVTSLVVGEADGIATVGVELSGPSARTITVSVTTSGTTTVGQDHQAVPSPIQFAPGATSATITIPLLADAVFEGPETLILQLSSPNQASLGSPSLMTITITDDDFAPVVAFASATASAPEAGGTIQLSVTMSAAAGVAVQVPYAFTGTAIQGSDFAALPGPLTIPAGSLAASISITIVDDTVQEGNESAIVTLGVPTGATLGTPSSTTLTIIDDDQPIEVAFTTGSTSAVETAGLVEVTVALTAAAATDVTVPFTITGTAIRDSDFAVASSPLTILAGQLTRTLSLILIDDMLDEGDETALFTLGTPTGAILGAANQHALTITDDDPPPTLTLVETALSVGEGEPAVQLTLSLSQPSGRAITVPFTLAGSASLGEDVSVTPSPVTIPAGSSLGTITVTPINDPWFEPAESISVTLGTPTNAILSGNSAATITLTDDDPFPAISFTQATDTVAEAAGSRVIGLALSGPIDADVVVQIALSGSASEGADYTFPSTTVVIPARNIAASVTLNVLQDNLDEPTETIVLTLGAPTNADLGSQIVHTVTLLDDDPTPVLQFAQTTITVIEGTPTAQLALVLTAASAAPISVPFTIGGTATPGVDFVTPTSPFTILPGETGALLPITLIDDLIAESDETIIVSLGTPTNAVLGTQPQTTVTIQDDETTVTASFSQLSQSATEADGVVVAVVSLSIAAPTELTIPLIVGGTGTAGNDFVVSPNPLVIPIGSFSGTVAVILTNDTLDEEDETVILTLDPPSGVVVGVNPTQTITILDNDPTPNVAFAALGQSANEGAGSVLVEVLLSSLSGRDVTVPFTVTGSATLPDDATITPNPLVILAGQASGFLTVALAPDAIDEFDESLVLEIGTPIGAIPGVITTHSMTILDDDQPPSISFSQASSAELESAGTITRAVVLSGPSGLPVSVDLLLGGTATSGVDYIAPASPLVIPAGSTATTVTIEITDDLLDEAAETASITFGSPVNVSIGGIASHLLTILDDDNEPFAGFSSATLQITEDAGPASITFELTQSTALPVTVHFTLSGSAVATDDFTAPTSPVVIPAGSTQVVITIPIVADLLDELNETVVLTIGTVENAIAGPVTVTTLTITDDDDAPSVSFQLPGQTASEADSPFSVVVALSAASGKIVTVPFTVGGTAGVTDAAVSAPPLTFPPGTTTALITVTPADDAIDEADETVILTLGAPIDAVPGTIMIHTVILTDDDAQPSVALDPLPGSIGEAAGTIVVGAALSAPSGLPVQVSVQLTGSATLPDDYTASAAMLSFAPGATSASIALTIVDDAIFEVNETIVITLASATGATIGVPASRTLTILDDDTSPAVDFVATETFTGEGSGSVLLQLSLSTESATTVTVPVALSGSATPGGDYTITPNPVVFAPGSTSATITVVVTDDALDEPDETAVLTLGAPSGAVVGSNGTHTVTIVDNDGAPTVDFDVPALSIDESGGTLPVTVNLSATTSLPVTIPYTLSGSASAADHNTAVGPLVIPAGQLSATIAVPIVDDLLHEANETLVIQLGLPVNASPGTVTQFTLSILDNDTAPAVRFASAAQTVAEAIGSFPVTIQLSTISGLAVQVDLVTSGTASLPGDYTLSATTATIPAGQTQTTVTVTVENDLLDESDETAVLTIDAAAGATVGSPSQHTFTITDDDNSPTLSFAVASSSAAEGDGTATVDVVLSAPSSQTVTIGVSAGGTATTTNDFTLNTPSLTFTPGQVTSSVSITLVGDSLFEGPETIILTLGSPTGALLGTPSVHTLTISDDNLPPVVGFPITAQAAGEAAGAVTVTVQLATISGLPAVIPFSVSGTAANGSDFTISGSPLTILAGSTTGTITITPLDDPLDEPVETVVVTLDLPTGATVGAAGTFTLSINDDDGQPTVSFAVAASSVNENEGPALLQVVLSTASGFQITVPFSDSGGGSASAGIDYSVPITPIIIPPGQTSGVIPITIFDDPTTEPQETVVIQIDTPTNAIFGLPAFHTVTILDNDGAAPCNLVYPQSDVVYPPGVAITPNVPTSGCGLPTLWTITPPLPLGLVLSAATGAISGTPADRSPEVVHTVTASNGVGSSSTTITVRCDPIFFFFGNQPTANYDPISGNIIPTGQSLPDPNGSVPVSLSYREDPNNQPVPNTFFATAGLSIAIAFDPLLIQAVQVDQGADILALDGGGGPDFWGPLIGTQAVTIGVLFSLTFGDSIVADVDREMAIIQYRPAAGALVGNFVGTTIPLPWGNPTGTPAVQNQVVLDGTNGITPIQTDPSVIFVPQ